MLSTKAQRRRKQSKAEHDTRSARSNDSAVPDAMAVPDFNLAGQRLGRKGRETRHRLVQTAERLLKEAPETPLSLTAIAKDSGVGLTTVYEYFGDLGEIVLALLEPIRAEMTAVIELLERPWPEGDEQAHALAFVEAHLRYTHRHASTLRLRNILADAGDQRFQRQRAQFASPIIAGLTRKIRHSRGTAARQLKHSAALGTTLTLAIERAATVATQNVYPQLIAEASGFAFEGQPEALAELITLAIKGKRQ